jgi:hypothetical protein
MFNDLVVSQPANAIQPHSAVRNLFGQIEKGGTLRA